MIKKNKFLKNGVQIGAKSTTKQLKKIRNKNEKKMRDYMKLV